MVDYRIDCINRDGVDVDYRIDTFGGIKPDGSRWRDTIDNVIGFIRQGHRFYTQEGGVTALVEVRQHPTSKRLYLATENDGVAPNNLLSLPECP